MCLAADWWLKQNIEEKISNSKEYVPAFIWVLMFGMMAQW